MEVESQRIAVGSHLMARLNKEDREMLKYLSFRGVYTNPTDFARKAIKEAFDAEVLTDEEMEECALCNRVSNRNGIYGCCRCGRQCCTRCLNVTAVMTCKEC